MYGYAAYFVSDFDGKMVYPLAIHCVGVNNKMLIIKMFA